mmetsp:Transcript_6748/g.11264  ORF Transcript_6748/g.11264 Transcript_6748/m.11264 type:complete len:121 (-) Transcript_6748:408-770(-)
MLHTRFFPNTFYFSHGGLMSRRSTIYLMSTVICEKVEKSKVEDIDKKKYLVPSDLTCGQFVYVIRKRLKLPAEKAIFLFVNGTIPPTAAMLNTVYEQHKDKDGFLYISYSDENVFGAPAD